MRFTLVAPNILRFAPPSGVKLTYRGHSTVVCQNISALYIYIYIYIYTFVQELCLQLRIMFEVQNTTSEMNNCHKSHNVLECRIMCHVL
jgi:hypothetical protein